MREQNDTPITDQTFLKARTDLLYLFGLALFFAYRTFFNTRMRREFGFQRVQTAEHAWLLFMLVLIAVKMLCEKCYSLREAVLGFLLIALCAAVWRASHTYWMLMFPLAVVGAKGVSFDKIVKVYLIVNGVLLGTAMVLSLTGVVENLQYVRWVPDESYAGGGYSVVRNSFGTTFPTTFSEFVFFWSAAWIYVRRKVLRYYDVLLLTVFSLFLLRFCDAVTDCICVGLLAAAVFWLLLKNRIADGLKAFLEKAGILLVLPMPLLGVSMSVLSYYYDANEPFWNALDSALHLRLSFGHVGLERYGIHLFGSWVKYQMNTLKENYFNLDCSYLVVLVNFGLLFFLVLLGWFAWTSWRAWRRKDAALLLLLAIIALECVMENRLMQPQYNVFCLIFFAEWGIENELSGRVQEMD